jgi:hypothetical protein
MAKKVIEYWNSATVDEQKGEGAAAGIGSATLITRML